MSRTPVAATAVVLLAIAAMIGLGLWQLQRRTEKLALLDVYAANRHRPAIRFPAGPDQGALFREAVLDCRPPVRITRQAGRSADGASGWRQIATCAGGAAVQLGVAATPDTLLVWPGGTVRGYVTHAPSHQPLIAGLFAANTPQPLMLVADAPLPGLRANPPADLGSVPNNHLAYAVQWFLFAGIAAIIYAVALRRRLATSRIAGDPRTP